MTDNIDLPFKQIEKAEIYAIKPNRLLFIIGNGFDSVSYTHLTLPTNREV